MPHVIIEGPLTVEDIWLAFKPLAFREGANHYKAEDILLSRDKHTALIRSLTVERGFTKNFYVRAVQKDDAISLGLEKLTMPDSSDGVKRLLGLYAWTILQSEPESVVKATDIKEFLGEPKTT